MLLSYKGTAVWKLFHMVFSKPITLPVVYVPSRILSYFWYQDLIGHTTEPIQLRHMMMLDAPIQRDNCSFKINFLLDYYINNIFQINKIQK